jgi:glycosyltransferase involved in cell wall biosynthesis
MRILYICADTGIDVLGRKGASVHVREMIAAFTRAGHAVELVAPRLAKPGADPAPTTALVHRARVGEPIQVARQGIDTFMAARGIESSLGKDVRRMLYDAELNAQLHGRYADSPPDLIYVRSSLFSTAGIDLAAASGRPLVIEVNSPLAAEQDRYRSGALGDLAARVEGELLRAATLVLVVSEALVEHAIGMGVERNRIVVSPNGVDPTRFHPHEVSTSRRRQLNIPGGPIIGFSGGLRAWHGANRLPAIAAGLRDRGVNVGLVIAGDGPERSAIEAEAARLDVSDRMVLLGAVDHDDMPDVISSFDVALAPYPPLDHDFYFSPLKLFEYLGCGVPVVASAVGQIASTVQSGIEALLTAPGDDNAIIEGCHRLLSDREFAARVGAAGARLVHRAYTWDHNAERALTVAARVTS